MDKTITLEEAMKVVCQAIREDKAYRIGWQANIAMAFKDEYNLFEQRGGMIAPPGAIHSIANKAADRFLNILIGESKECLPDGSSFFTATI